MGGRCVGALAAAAALLCTAVAGAGSATPYAPRPARLHHRVSQTSDGEPGAKVGPVAPGPQMVTLLQSFPVVPGVDYYQYAVTDARGRVREELLRVDPSTPGLSLDYVDGATVTTTAPLLGTVVADGGIAGVNGDFFDIGDTGAPLGVGVDRQRGVLHAVVSGWDSAFWIDGHGDAHVGQLVPRIRVTSRRHRLDVRTYNAPSVPSGAIGLYDARWGVLRRHRVVDGQTHHVRMVALRHGRVLWNRRTLPRFLRVSGRVLVGRGAGARALASLTRGRRVHATIRVGSGGQGRPRVAITGSTTLLAGGQRTVTDDVDLHPRTAVGIDATTGEILLLVADGRVPWSRGYTLVELAAEMQRLGATDALNLDGGGSSTLVARMPDGVIGVLNHPSDGHPRSVPNGLEVLSN